MSTAICAGGVLGERFLRGLTKRLAGVAQTRKSILRVGGMELASWRSAINWQRVVN